MRPKLPPERPSLHSRANHVATTILAYGVVVMASPGSTNPWVQAAISAALAGGVTMGWNSLSAAAFINRNQQPQTLYEIPWNEGVIVAQPRHQLELNPWRRWRGYLRDTMTDHLYTIHGYFANRELADQYCQNVSKVGNGLWVDRSENDPALRTMVQTALHQADAQFTMHNRQPAVPLTTWNISHLPDIRAKYCAYRQVLTDEGARWEFYPRPPQGLSDTARLKKEIRPYRSVLDQRHVDSSLQSMSNTVREAWNSQTASWHMIPVDTTDPARAHSWVALHLSSDDKPSVIAWVPEPPKTLSRHDLWHQLAPQLGPLAIEPGMPLDVAAWQTAWACSAVALQGLPMTPAIMVSLDHPIVQATGFSSEYSETMRCVVPQFVRNQKRWLGLELSSAVAGAVAVRALQRIDKPSTLWISHDPMVLQSVLQATPQADFVPIHQTAPPIITDHSPSPPLPTADVSHRMPPFSL